MKVRILALETYSYEKEEHMSEEKLQKILDAVSKNRELSAEDLYLDFSDSTSEGIDPIDINIEIEINGKWIGIDSL